MLGNSPSEGGPDGGNKACVWQVNQALKRAGLRPFGSDFTAAAYDQLRAGRGIPLSENELQPGDIIVSPTMGKNTGHIGIYMGNGEIYSNSSARRDFLQNFTLSRWNRYYGGRGLKTYYFRLRN